MLIISAGNSLQVNAPATIKSQWSNPRGTSQARGVRDGPHERRATIQSAESNLAPFSQTLKVGPLANEFPQQVLPEASAENHQRQHDLQTLTSNYEMILQHFSLRKTPTKRTVTALPAVDKPHRRRGRPSITRLLTQSKHCVLSGMRSSIEWLWHPFDPQESVVVAFWTCLLLSVHVFQIFYLPFAPVYLRYTAATQSSMVSINIALELFFVLDIALTFHTAVEVNRRDQREEGSNTSDQCFVRSHLAIAQLYIFQGSFWMDLLGSLPFETIAYMEGRGSCLLQTNRELYFVGTSLRLLRFYSLPRVLRKSCLQRLRYFSRPNSGLTMILAVCLKCGLLMVVIAHFGACGLRQLTFRDGAMSAYEDDLLQVLTWLLGNGVGPHEDSAISCYAVAILLAGLFLSLYIMASIVLAISESRLTPNRKIERKLSALAAKMKKLDLPSELQDRIQQYYSYLWRDYDAFTGDLNGFARDLTRPLALEVGLCRYMCLVLQVSFWSDCSAALISALVVSLSVRVHLADDYIVRKGEISTELVLIYRGTAEMSTNDRTNGLPLSEGSVFGEVNLLVDCTRTTSVRAIAFMEICVLTRKHFQKRILKQYPDEARSVMVRILRSGLESESYPILWQLASQCARTVEAEMAADSDQKTQSDGNSSSLEMTSSEAAEILVNNLHRLHAPLPKQSPLLDSEGDYCCNTTASCGRSLRQHGTLSASRHRASSRTSSISSVDKHLSFFFPPVQQRSSPTEESALPPSTPAAHEAPQQPAIEPVADPVLLMLQTLADIVKRMEHKLELLETMISQQTDDNDDNDVASGTGKRPNSSVSGSQIALALANAQASVENRPARDEHLLQSGRKKRSKSLAIPARLGLAGRPAPVQSQRRSDQV